MATPTVDEIMGKIKSVNTCATNCPTCAPVIAGIRTTLEALVAERDRMREAGEALCYAVERAIGGDGFSAVDLGNMKKAAAQFRTALSSNP